MFLSIAAEKVKQYYALSLGMTNPPDFEVTTAGAIALPIATVARKSPSRLFWERFRQDKAALAGGVVIGVLTLIAIFGGPLAQSVTGHPQNTTYSQMTDAFGVPKGPNSQFWFGADAAGRDLFVRTMYGARTSLFVGVVASGLAVLIGLVVGLAAGFFGGIVDTVLMTLALVGISTPVFWARAHVAVHLLAPARLDGGHRLRLTVGQPHGILLAHDFAVDRACAPVRSVLRTDDAE